MQRLEVTFMKKLPKPAQLSIILLVAHIIEAQEGPNMKEIQLAQLCLEGETEP